MDAIKWYFLDPIKFLLGEVCILSGFTPQISLKAEMWLQDSGAGHRQPLSLRCPPPPGSGLRFPSTIHFLKWLEVNPNQIQTPWTKRKGLQISRWGKIHLPGKKKKKTQPRTEPASFSVPQFEKPLRQKRSQKWGNLRRIWKGIHSIHIRSCKAKTKCRTQRKQASNTFLNTIVRWNIL